MAHEPVCPPEVTARLKAIINGRASSQSLDRKRSDSISSGTVLAKALTEQGSHSNLGGDGGSGSGAKEAGGLTGDRELSKPPATLPANPFTASSNILQDIAARFNYARETQKVGAWKQLQTDLMNASPFICPVLIPLKDLINIAQDIEKEIKGANTQVGKSNEVLLSEFLNGEGDIKVKLDNSVRIEERDEETPLASNASEAG